MTEKHLANASAGAGGTVEELAATLGLVNGLVMDLRDHADKLAGSADAALASGPRHHERSLARIPTACPPTSPVSPAICGNL